MAWPVSQDYNEAIQSPASNFADPDLRRGEAVANALGIPMPYSGNFADVYQVRCPDGKSWAVKCFTRQAAGLRERYQEISKHLRDAKLPFMVDFTYLDQGIRVAGKWYPVLKMQWVEGLTLNQFVGKHADRPAMLDALLFTWRRMAVRLRDAQVGHCDLQHGNILLAPGSSANRPVLKLIDYDGMWVPALSGTKSGEAGHAAYQHPQRMVEGTYSLDVDRFPILLIATALSAVRALGRPLWDKYDNGDNILFKESDLRSPQRSALFAELLDLNDPLTRELVSPLYRSLWGVLGSAPRLTESLGIVAAVASVASEAAMAANPSIPAAGAVITLGLDGTGPRKVKIKGIPAWAWAAASAFLALAVIAACGLGFLASSPQADPDPPTPLHNDSSQPSAAPAARPPVILRGDASVLLQIDPPGAEVTVDGVRQPVDGAADGHSVLVWTKPGSHRICVSKSGFMPFTENFQIREGEHTARLVRLDPDDRPSPGRLMIHVIVAIDGKDEMRMTPAETRWSHLEAQPTTEVKINSMVWNPQSTPLMADMGASRLLGKEMNDLSKVTMTKVRGRGAVTLHAEKDYFSVLFDDPQAGADVYEVVIGFDK